MIEIVKDAMCRTGSSDQRDEAGVIMVYIQYVENRSSSTDAEMPRRFSSMEADQ